MFWKKLQILVELWDGLLQTCQYMGLSTSIVKLHSVALCPSKTTTLEGSGSRLEDRDPRETPWEPI